MKTNQVKVPKEGLLFQAEGAVCETPPLIPILPEVRLRKKKLVEWREGKEAGAEGSEAGGRSRICSLERSLHSILR